MLWNSPCVLVSGTLLYFCVGEFEMNFDLFSNVKKLLGQKMSAGPIGWMVMSSNFVELAPCSSLLGVWIPTKILMTIWVLAGTLNCIQWTTCGLCQEEICVRSVIFMGGLLSALLFSREGFCPPCHFYGRAFVRFSCQLEQLDSGHMTLCPCDFRPDLRTMSCNLMD